MSLLISILCVLLCCTATVFANNFDELKEVYGEMMKFYSITENVDWGTISHPMGVEFVAAKFNHPPTYIEM